MQMMKSLVNVNLDYNTDFGSAGVAAIARGLCTNSTLKILSLRYCHIDECGGVSLSNILSSPRIAISSLDLTGNRLGGKGLGDMCSGISLNSSLQKLNLSDNNIMSTEFDLQGIKQFSNALRENKSLVEVNLMYNPIGVEAGLALVDGIEGNKRITSFMVDKSLPSNIYSVLNRVSRKGKGKSKKSKKKKKKKK